MRHGSLFSGIGGFDLAAEWMGWQNVFHCEWNEFGQKVLKHHFTKSISYADINKTDFSIHRGDIDILTGGFPCQPYSSAGKRKGKEDERHLWPQMLRAIREIAPSWVVGENVYGLVNWSGGLVFHEVQSDLEAEGYEVFPFLLPAVSINAPHRRDRIWFVAHSTRSSERTNELRGIRCSDAEAGRERTQTIYDAIRPNGDEGTSADPNSNGLNQCHSQHEINTSQGGEYAQRDSKQSNGDGDATNTTQQRLEGCRREKGRYPFLCRGQFQQWQNFPTQSPVRRGDDGIPRELDGISFPKWRNESIKAYGNAVVPQVVYQIFKTIEDYEKMGF